ncbi:nitroreductase [Desulfatibacillum aliphaticivorans]|uniref:Nitroreductase n=1 Tax=Desulfatibacillum aliphaticivorans TaxID=218208 RepID=B8FJ20_DESAL|nr:nitroreductase [Desulfatibacillum aliphaticivorans]ACL04947.1 nitroreductase [Desulfatibacillum aliphaticivorans]
MNILDAVRARKSIRNFLPDPVPKELLSAILEDACRAPSANNTQPWECFMLGGDVLEKVRKANLEQLRAGVFPEPESALIDWPKDSVYRTRQVDLAIELFRLMDIQRDDHEGRAKWMERGFGYFNAPAALIVVADKCLPENSPLLDIGCFLQTFCLLCTANGLGACIEGQGVMYSKTLRQIVGIPDEKRIIMAVAVGYPDWDFPANAIKSSRVSANDLTTWVGFD